MNYRRCRLPTTDVRGVSGIISLQHPSLPDFIAKRFIGLSEHRLLRCGGFPQIPIRHHSPWSTRPASPTLSPLHQPFIAHHGPLPSTKSKAIKHATRFGAFSKTPTVPRSFLSSFTTIVSTPTRKHRPSIPPPDYMRRDVVASNCCSQRKPLPQPPPPFLPERPKPETLHFEPTSILSVHPVCNYSTLGPSSSYHHPNHHWAMNSRCKHSTYSAAPACILL